MKPRTPWAAWLPGRSHISEVFVHICHATSAHPSNDPRITYKEALSAVRDGHTVTLVSADPLHSPPPGVDHILVPRSRTRAGRMAVTASRVAAVVRRLEPDVCHVHDPELLPWVLLRARSRTAVIYDMHEDLPAQITSKRWIPTLARRPVAALARIGVRALTSRASGVVFAAPNYVDLARAKHSAIVQNFPRLDPDETPVLGDSARSAPEPCTVVYVGAITPIRGAAEMITACAEAATSVPLRLVIAGRPAPADYIDELVTLPGWPVVDYVGLLEPREIPALLDRSDIGICLFSPVQHHVASYPTKLFEYMAVGLPLVVSDFPLWREIVEQARCGVLVDPLDIGSIARVLVELARDPDSRHEMGQAGRQTAWDKYSWESQYKKLDQLYRDIANAAR